MQESYEDMMLPLFLRLGGNDEQLHMDQDLEAVPVAQASSPVTMEETSNALVEAHRVATRALE